VPDAIGGERLPTQVGYDYGQVKTLLCKASVGVWPQTVMQEKKLDVEDLGCCGDMWSAVIKTDWMTNPQKNNIGGSLLQ